MEECFKCGINENKALLFDAIGNEGIVKICSTCASKESIPIIRKPTNFSSEGIPEEPRQSVYERLSTISGYKNREREQTKTTNNQDTKLRQLVEKNYEASVSNTSPRDDLINNFHWVIMRMRRKKKMTQEQFAESLAVPVSAIKKAEQGFISDDALISKIENSLGISIRRVSPNITRFEADKKRIESQIQKDKVNFDDETTRTLTISDLQRLKEQKEKNLMSQESNSKKYKSEFSDINSNEIEFEEDEQEEKRESFWDRWRK